MSLKDCFLDSIDDIFCIFEDSVRVVIYKNFASFIYDTTAGNNVTPSTDYGLIGILTCFSNKEIDGEHIKMGDMELMVKGENIGFSPNLEDQVEYNSKKYQVINWENIEEYGIMYWFHLRLSSG